MNRNFRDKELHKVALNGYINTSSDIDKSMFYVLIILFVLNSVIANFGGLNSVLLILFGISNISIMFTIIKMIKTFTLNKKYFGFIIENNENEILGLEEKLDSLDKSMVYYFNFCVIVSTISILFNILIVW